MGIDTSCALMFGNSFTRTNGLPDLLSKELSREVEIHVCGGEHASPSSSKHVMAGIQAWRARSLLCRSLLLLSKVLEPYAT